MATMDYYSIYGALLQTPVEGPGFADAWTQQKECQIHLLFHNKIGCKELVLEQFYLI